MLLDVAAPKDNKEELLTVKMTPTMLREAHIMADIEHSNISNIVRQFVGRKIDAAKEKKPEAFKVKDEVGLPSFTVKLKRGKAKAARHNKG